MRSNGWRYKLYQFMQGRRGIDSLSKFLLYFAMILTILSIFIFHNVLYYIGIAIFILAYIRIFSRNIYKREKENIIYMALRYKYTGGRSLRQIMNDRKYYKYFKCPTCKQKMRIPKGKGTVRVKCHNCG